MNFLNSFRFFFLPKQPSKKVVPVAERAEIVIDYAVEVLRGRRSALENEIFIRTQELHQVEVAIEAYETAQRVFIDAKMPALQSTLDESFAEFDFSGADDDLSNLAEREGELGFDSTTNVERIQYYQRARNAAEKRASDDIPNAEEAP